MYRQPEGNLLGQKFEYFAGKKVMFTNDILDQTLYKFTLPKIKYPGIKNGTFWYVTHLIQNLSI